MTNRAGQDGKARLATGGSVAAAILSAACCWLPLLLIAVGVSAGGMSAFFERWRPVFAAVAFGLLALGFYIVYWRRKPCAEGSCARPRGGAGRAARVLLWVSAALVVAFVFFPYYAGGLIRAWGSGRASAPGDQVMTTASTSHRYRIEGMHCEACAATIESEVSKVAGVTSVTVDYGAKSAVVESSDAGIDRAVVEAVKRAGYTARPKP